MPRWPERKLDFETGLLSLSERQEEFLDWLCGDRTPSDTYTSYSKEHDIPISTLSGWRKDPSFLERWETRMRDGAAHPDILSTHLKALDKRAKSGDVKAIELYWRLVDKMTPDRLELKTESRPTEELSDDELAEKLSSAAEQFRPRLVEPESAKEQAARVRAELGLTG